MEAMQRRVAHLFPGHRGPRTINVGVEHELLAVDARTGAPVAIDRLRDAVSPGSTTGRASYADAVTFEPGGQLELSLPAATSPSLAMEQFRSVLASAEADTAAIGVTLVALPVDPRPEDEVPLQLTSPRYLGMQAHFDGIGPAGRRMMRRTASTQICLDWWPGAAGLEQWRVLQLAGPFLAAAFARSTGFESRLATWLEADPGRTAFDGRLLVVDDPVAAYADFARGAVDFLAGGLDAHLTTLFPPVRPRGRYLEVRWPDVQEEQGVAQLLRVMTTLAYDDELRGQVLKQLAEEVARLGEWLSAAAAGLVEVTDRGLELVRMTEAAAWRAPAGYLPAAQPPVALGGAA